VGDRESVHASGARRVEQAGWPVSLITVEVRVFYPPNAAPADVAALAAKVYAQAVAELERRAAP
jgi:hypothetical protein